MSMGDPPIDHYFIDGMKDQQLGDLQRQVAVLQIQNARLKMERDQAQAAEIEYGTFMASNADLLKSWSSLAERANEAAEPIFKSQIHRDALQSVASDGIALFLETLGRAIAQKKPCLPDGAMMLSSDDSACA